MKNKFVTDRVEFASRSQRQITDEGFLKVPATIARTGTQEYTAGAIDFKGLPPDQVVKVFRPPNEVFNQDSMDSFALKPVTNGHPLELVNIDNIKQYSVGNAGSLITRAGDTLKTVLLVTDKSMINAVNAGKCEISNGYVADFDYTAGTTETGERYDATMTNIRGNHIAIVDQARGGRGLRLSDEKQTGENMKKYMFDKVEIEVSEQALQVIDSIEGKMKVVSDELATAKSEAVTAQATFDAAIAGKDQEIADAKALIVDAAEMERLVSVRGKLVADAKELFDAVETEGKSADEIVEAVVVKCCDGIEAGDKSADYCKARFDALLIVKDSAGDGSDRVVIDADKDKDEDEGEKARMEYKNKTENAWKGEDK